MVPGNHTIVKNYVIIRGATNPNRGCSLEVPLLRRGRRWIEKGQRNHNSFELLVLSFEF